MINFMKYVDSVSSSLNRIHVTDSDGRQLDVETGLCRWCDMTNRVKQSNSTMYFIGNGASSTMASHMAADASKNGDFRSQAFNDTAFMTAISNDISYEECFALPLKLFADDGDILVTISSSGNSHNIIRTIETARTLELGVITLSGMKPNNLSRKLGDINFYIPADTYGIVESSHQVLLHCWLDKFAEEYE